MQLCTDIREISGSIYHPCFQQLLAVKGKCLLWRFLVLLRNIQITDTINYIVPPFFLLACFILSLCVRGITSPLFRRGYAPGIVNYKKGCTKVYQLFAYDPWFSPGIPVSSATKTGRLDIAEILLKVALKHQRSINQISSVSMVVRLDSGIVSTVWCFLFFIC